MSGSEFLTANHWGVGLAKVENERLCAVADHPADPTPSRINENIASSLNGKARVLRPAVRKGWLDNGPGGACGRRSCDAFVEVSWDYAYDLLADELNRVRTTHGNHAIFGGSYGWGSAGRFHHAQSQLKRFLNACGGFVNSFGNYSYHAAIVLMPHIVKSFGAHVQESTRWSVVAEHSELVLMFGGLAARNAQVAAGGVSQHVLPDALRKCAESGVRFVNLSPLRSDAADQLDAEWLPPLPGSDVAIMMGMAHTLVTQDLHDVEFLQRYTVGFDALRDMLLGKTDGVPKTPAWAEAQSGIPADRIAELAREAASSRTMISISVSLQRADFGEQPLWMTVALAAMLGQIGLPGGGYGIGYGSDASIGCSARPFRWPSFPQGENQVSDFIPVAMIADMLLNPGASYDFNGVERRFPDIRLLWWAGGNPFHHHQDLNRLRQAFQRPETVIVNEINWTATARHADIILPVAAAQERTDFAAGNQDNSLIPMRRVVLPPGEAKTEFEIYCALEERLQLKGAFSAGRTAEQWLELLWKELRQDAHQLGQELPDLESFLDGGPLTLPDPAPGRVLLADFRADPEVNPLPTPSGRIELASQKIASFNYDDCPGYPSWFLPRDLAAGKTKDFPLALLTGQPAGRLHSQMDNGSYSQSLKIDGRERLLIHPNDAAARTIRDGDIIQLRNDQGSTLAAAKVISDIREGVVFLWTGAWFDPDDRAPNLPERNGNPNVLTHDLRTSRLSQGPAAHSSYVEVMLFDEPLPKVRAYAPPEFVNADPNKPHAWDHQPREKVGDT